MASDFDRVVVRTHWDVPGMMDFLLYPFPHTGGTIMMNKATEPMFGNELVDWMKPIVDALWEKVPGLKTLVVENGLIRIWHHKVFSNEEIGPIIEEFLKPILEEALKTKKLLD